MSKKPDNQILPAGPQKCNCAHSEFPLEWSRYALVWLHRHPKRDRRCMNPPFEYRLVRAKNGEPVELREGEKARDWYEAFPNIYRLERRLMVPWADASTAGQESLAQGERREGRKGKTEERP